MRAAWLGALSAAWMASSWPAHRRFRQALDTPETAQAAALARVLAGARDSTYGIEHGLAKVRTAAEWRAAVPLTTYDTLAPWIERVKNGEANVLSTQRVLMLETTGGSSAAAKYIPYTEGLRAEFNRALQPWMFDLYTRRPRLLTAATYWSVSPAARQREVTAGGVPVGFADDTEYFGGVERFVMGQLMPAPGALSQLTDIDDNRWATLLFLLAEERLGLVSVWNPTFWTLLMDFLEKNRAGLARDLERGTITLPSGTPAPAALSSRFGKAKMSSWPHLSVISCWASASAARFVPELRARFPRVEIQPKGLLATEGVVTIPLWDQPAPVLAIESHFYEFMPAGGGAPRLAHELEAGGEYAVALSTSGGLYRYQLGDLVKVVGHLGRTPLLEFLGRDAGTSDICGEKLAEAMVARVLDAALAGVSSGFSLLAPWLESPPRYVLHLESGAPDEALVEAAARVEAGLAANPHYAYARRLGQLAPVAAFRIASGGAAAHLAACVARGQKPGSVKCAVLERASTWETAFPGRRVD